jgi:tRNA G10  N-methylase Trm11
MKHIFHLGRNPELSILEAVSFLERTKRKYQIKKITKQSILIEIEKFDPKKAINQLGGTIKISSELTNSKKHIEITLSNQTKNKITYGINKIESSSSHVQKLIKTIKDSCREQKIKVLQKYSSEREIPPTKAKNLDIELTVYKGNYYKVSAISDPKSYKKRDEKRPNFEPLKVVSVRLAKILINLAQPKKDDLLLDPFTGLGTILQEATLMDVKSTGSDKYSNTVKKCKQNLDWLKKEFNLKTIPQVKIADVAKLSSKIKKADAIATEPYLGPYLMKLPTEQEAREIAKEVSKIYEDLLRESSKILKNGSKMAIIVPTFKTKNSKIIRIGFQTLLEKYGFKIHQPLRNTLVPIDYILRNSKIRRKIYVLERLK